MACTVTTLNFEGPLDLLLHLIKESKMNIFEIEIASITEQYLKYINKMEDLNLNVDSEYLIMATELIEMKSRELLPNNSEEDDDDPRQELINRLVEYQRYKEVTNTLKELREERKMYFSKTPSILSDFQDDKIKINDEITLDDLIKAFALIKEKQKLERPLNTVITQKEYSIHKRSREILSTLKTKRKMYFDDLFDIWTKSYVIVTFLSILDLAKKGKLNIKQEYNLDKIIITAR